MSPRAVPRPHAPVRGRSWTSSLHRPAVGLLVLCICGSFFFVWNAYIGKTQSGLVTSSSGHAYHPKLCNSLGGTGDASSSTACSELHDPTLAQEVVRLPVALQMMSDDPQVATLRQLLQVAVEQQWPLPLARRVTLLLLQAAVPPVQSSSSNSSDGGDSKQQETTAAAAMTLSAVESGHGAGWQFATEAVSVLVKRAASQLVPCSFDPSLPTDFHTRFLYTATWPAASTDSSSSTALANSVLQLLNTVALLPPGYAYISVFVPAGAAADSLVWLDILQLLAAPLGVPVQAVQSATAGLQPQQSTGTAASQARNAAMAAFFPTTRAAAAAARTAAKMPPTQGAAASTVRQQEGGSLDDGRKLHALRQLGGDSATSTSSSSNAGGGRVSHGSCPAGRPSPGCYGPEFVVLVEPQLYFCAADLVRLMEYPEDLACGLQLDEFKPVQLRHRQHRRRQLHNDATAAGPRQLQQQQAATATAGTASVALHEGPMAAAVAAASQAVLQPEVPPEFELHSLRAAYDPSREISGEMLSAHAPYFTSHGPSQELVTAGLPVPMYCCWGGVAKLHAEALAAGLRFRGGEEGECHPPDPMSLMCDDLWRTGRNRIIMVRLATSACRQQLTRWRTSVIPCLSSKGS